MESKFKSVTNVNDYKDKEKNNSEDDEKEFKPVSIKKKGHSTNLIGFLKDDIKPNKDKDS